MDRVGLASMSVSAAIVAVSTSGMVPAAPAAAQRAELPLGTCVTAYGNTGRIVESIQNGYRIATDADPTGTAMVAPASDTKPSACKTAAPPAVRAAAAAPNPAPAMAGGGTGCFVSSAPAGLAGRGQAFAAVLLRHWTVPADPGSDGATTAQIQSLQIGTPHAAIYSDLRQYAVAPGGAVYPLRLKFTLCKDYRTYAHYHAAEENAVCFAAAAGGTECSLTGHTAGLADPRDWDVRK